MPNIIKNGQAYNLPERTNQKRRFSRKNAYFTKRSMSETEPAMRCLKFQMREKVLP